jgi:hypothetical protein
MLSSSFLPGHQVPTPMKLPPLGLTVGIMVRKGGKNGESYLPHLLLTELLVSCTSKGEPRTYIWSIGGVSAVATVSEGYTDSKHTGLSSQTSRRSLKIQSRTLHEETSSRCHLFDLPYMEFCYC